MEKFFWFFSSPCQRQCELLTKVSEKLD
jgi:hypothetical protein